MSDWLNMTENTENTEQLTEDDELLAAFVDESLELLQDLPATLDGYRRNPGDSEQINSVFRAIHSIKGNAGFFGLTGIKKFSHSLENTLDDVRGGKLPLEEKLNRSLVDGFDILDELLNLALEGQIGTELGDREIELLRDIEELTATIGTVKSPEELLAEDLRDLADEMAHADFPEADEWAERLGKLVSTITGDPQEETTAATHEVESLEAKQVDSKSSSDATSTDESDNRVEDRPTEHKAADSSTGSTARSRYLRVKEECVDAFLNDVSRLFITNERLKDLYARMALKMESQDLVDELRQINSGFSSQANALQGSVVALRRVPVRGLFAKFPRVARTLASKLGKQLNVHLSGEELEIDKSLVEDLDAPLMHMIRNVCDHGIESPVDRRARGVPEAGNLWLACELTHSHVIITVKDDGRGIDPDRLRQKAVEKGILTAEQADLLSDEDAIDLVFHAGFSTAENISDVSGRGVGLDVVRSTLRDYDGDIQVTSQVGQGTTFRLEFPLRKAVVVVDGLLVRQNDDTFIMPFEFIRQIFEFDGDQISSVQGRLVARIRGEPFSAISLGELLGTETPAYSAQTSVRGVLVTCKAGSICLLVDAVLGQRKVVVNNLSDVLDNTGLVSGVAQLGGGQLALVLSASELISGAKSLAVC